MSLFHPGTSEVGWLADLKAIAEQEGRRVFGEAVRWDVEVVKRAGSKRPDVVIRSDVDGQVIASGEAKRPDTPAGVHPLVASEIGDAYKKATELGAPVFFTTNFFEAGVFRTSLSSSARPLEGLQGSLVKIVPESLAKATDWWSVLGVADRNAHVVIGLGQLFERIKAAQQRHVPLDINEVALLVFSRVTDRLVQPLFEVLLNERDAGRVSAELRAHALRVHLVLEEDEQLRFLVAQGVAEVLTALLFYRNIADHFSLGELLGGTVPKTASAFVARLERSLKHATAVSGDYETILGLSPIASFVLSNGGLPALQHWKDLVAFVDQLDFSAVTSDVIGAIFERLISPERRYAMGQHYTNARVARSMSRWVVRRPTDNIADVSCGAGTFLVELHRLLASHGRSHSHVLAQLLGNDMDPFAVHLASINLVTRDIYRGANYPAVRLGDAFDIRPGVPIVDVQPSVGPRVLVGWPNAGIDAIVGNPPYAEKPDDASRLKTALAALGTPAPPLMSGGNLAAWFFLLATALIRADGVIALVMPTGVLQNGNLEVWRSWLRRRFDVVLWHCEDDVWFSDARVATCVILAMPRSTAGSFGRLTFVNVRERVEGALFEVGGAPSPVKNATSRDLSDLDAGADILVAGAIPQLLIDFGGSSGVQRLGSMKKVTVFSGNKLGHAFFQLRDRAPTKSSVVRSVSGHKMDVDISRQYLKPLLSSPKDERTGEFTGSSYWVLNAPERVSPTGQLHKYIDHARRLRVHEKASVAQRGARWWSVDWRESQVAVQIHPGFLHQVWWGAEPFVAKNNFHTLHFGDDVAQVDREVIAASLASGWGALSALYVSSEVGCEGVRWLSTAQLDQWPVLVPSKISKGDRAAVLSAYRLFRKLRAEEIPAMDQSATDAWLVLTEAVARAAGLATPKAMAQQCIAIARDTCERRTRREAFALAGRVRRGGSSGRTLARHVQEKLAVTPEAAEVVIGLTAGADHVRLRASAELAQGALDFGQATSAIDGERELAALLGAGFECAPISNDTAPDHLARSVERLLSELVQTVVGPRPSEDDAAMPTYIETADEVTRAAVQWLQQEVGKRLS